MKTMKRIVTLALALMMAFSTLVMPAMAVDEHVHTDECCDETIMPRKPGAPMCICGQAMSDVGTGRDNNGPYMIYKCFNSDCKNYGETCIVYL